MTEGRGSVLVLYEVHRHVLADRVRRSLYALCGDYLLVQSCLRLGQFQVLGGLVEAARNGFAELLFPHVVNLFEIAELEVEQCQQGYAHDAGYNPNG